MANQMKTTLLLAGLTVLIMLVGRMIGGTGGMVIALVLAGAMNFFSYWYSHKIVLSMYKAREVNPKDAPELYRMVEELAQNAGLPMPKVYIIPQEQPNAFATGRNPSHAVVAVTEGLLGLMDKDEVRGVLAHEMAHIKDRDILISSIAATMAGAVMLIANIARFAAFFGAVGGNDDEGPGILGLLLTAILAPIAALLIQMGISRSREYLADRMGAQIAGSPDGLANALHKLGSYTGRIPMDAKPETAHMFIVNPLSGKSLASLFSTHPPLEERIKRLRGAQGASYRESRTGKEGMSRNAKDFWDRMQS